MKKQILILTFISLFSISSAHSLDSTIFEYFPLKVGNSWTYFYQYSGSNYYISYYFQTVITGTMIYNSHTYFKIQTLGPCPGSRYCRIDSISGNLYQYGKPGCAWSEGEAVVDSLNAHLNDLFSTSCSYRFKCIDTSYVKLIDNRIKSKTFYISGVNEVTRKYAAGYGNYFVRSVLNAGSHSNVSVSQLTGCYIDGIVHGDTSLTGKISQSYGIPEGFMLFQNYPNPFNPTTNIKFSIPERTFIKIIIYDQLGKELTTLVNEDLSAGTFETQWNAEKYSSGIYYYRLITEKFSETKKMLLIK